MRKKLIIVIALMGLLHLYILYQLLDQFNPIIYVVGALLAVFSWIIIPLGLSARFLIKKSWLADAVTWVGRDWLKFCVNRN